jgi:hypothetical protein
VSSRFVDGYGYGCGADIAVAAKGGVPALLAGFFAARTCLVTGFSFEIRRSKVRGSTPTNT